jgi:hypothetical protein
MMPTPTPGPLLSVRAAVVLLSTVTVETVAEVLGYSIYGQLSIALLIGGGALALLDRLLERQ